MRFCFYLFKCFIFLYFSNGNYNLCAFSELLFLFPGLFLAVVLVTLPFIHTSFFIIQRSIFFLRRYFSSNSFMSRWGGWFENNLPYLHLDSVFFFFFFYRRLKKIQKVNQFKKGKKVWNKMTTHTHGGDCYCCSVYNHVTYFSCLR